MQDDTSQSAKGVAAIFAVGGLVVGALAVFFAMRAGGAAPSVNQLKPVASVAAPPDTVPSDAEVPATDPTTAVPVAEGAPPEAVSPPSATAPTLPPPRELGGTVRAGVPPTLGGTAPFRPPTPDTALRAPEVRLVRLNVYTSGADAARSEVESFVQSLGAETRAFMDFGVAEREPSVGLLILVPDKQVEAAVKYVQSRNRNVAEQSWRVTPQQRQSRLDDETQTALFALKAKRQELLVKYLDDADPVREVEAAITQAEASLRRLRIAATEQSLTAIKVTFGPRG